MACVEVAATLIRITDSFWLGDQAEALQAEIP